jgi:phenylpropionate dioxygenase-like ring-hydroxylating dioxygenase large terminal subunit
MRLLVSLISLSLCCWVVQGYTVAPTSSWSQGKPAQALANNKKKFDWHKQWHAIAVPEFLDASKPHRLKLLGDEYVLWFSQSQNNWSLFADECPHRLAPLSQGIVVGSTLLCSYHAWRFDVEGLCTSIPQSRDYQKQKHQSAPRACAKAFPLRLDQGILFWWPESGLQALAESALQSPSLIPDLDDAALMASGRVTVLPLNFRELPYGWETCSCVAPQHDWEQVQGPCPPEC